jgi:hypothetical protein
MTDDEYFNDVLAGEPDFGRKVEIESLSTSSANVYRQMSNDARNLFASAVAKLPTLPPIYFGITDNGVVNACAFRGEDKYFVAVNWGAVYVAQLMFNRILADSRFLPQIGDPREETEQPPIRGWQKDDWPNGLHLQLSGNVIKPPQNEVRKKYAYYLEQQFITFLLAHELTHIVNGHIEYFNEIYGTRAYVERTSSVESNERLLTHQTLEMDADSGAVSTQIGTIKAKFTEPDKYLNPYWKDFYIDPPLTTYNWSFAVSLFFRLFGDQPYKDKQLLDSTYPPDRVRQMIVQTVSSTYIGLRWDDSLVDRCAKAETDAMLDLENIFPVITDTPREIQGFKESWDGSGFAHAMVLEEHWKNKVRPDLLKYAHGNLPE